LKVEVVEYLIGPPVADQVDDVGVDVGKKKSHSAPGRRDSAMMSSGRKLREGRRQGWRY
jgi:hypothetical protein